MHDAHSPAVPWWQITVTDEDTEAVVRAIGERHISQGPITAEFERALAERLGVADTVCTTSGTMALMMAYIAAGVGPGTEVIIPNRTWVATANAAKLLGAQVVLVDVKASDPMVDAAAIEDRITERTKAIVPVALNGAAPDMARINAIAAAHGTTVVEDACQALFSRSLDGFAGTNSRFGCFSLGMAKLITTGSGGFVACQSADDAALLKRIRNQGMSDYDLSEKHGQVGGNFKFTDIQAAIGLSQLSRIDERIRHQVAIYETYAAGLENVCGIDMVKVDTANGEVPLRAEVVCADRVGVAAHLKDHNIECLLQCPNLAEYPFFEADPAAFPNSARFADTNLVLPSGPTQPLANVERTIDALQTYGFQPRTKAAS